MSVTAGTEAEFVALRELRRDVDHVAIYDPGGFALTGGGEPERLDGATASVNVFSLLGVEAVVGRTFAPDEDQAGHDRVVVLADGLWRRRYGADPRMVGRTVLVDGAARTVIGVMPSGFRWPTAETQLWLPMVLAPAASGAYWGAGGKRVIARLDTAATLAGARADVRRRYRQLRLENPAWDPGPTYGNEADVVPLQAKMVGSVRSFLLVLLGVVALVLLIAWPRAGCARSSTSSRRGCPVRRRSPWTGASSPSPPH